MRAWFLPVVMLSACSEYVLEGKEKLPPEPDIEVTPLSIDFQQRLGWEKLRARITAVPEHRDKICTQTSVSFPPTVGAKYRQDLQFGSQEWARWYKTMRSTVEGFNGYIKDAAFEDLETPARRRLRGRAAQQLLVTLLVVSANIRKLRTWIALQAEPTKIVQMTARRDNRRARQSLQNYLPPANAPPGTPTAVNQ